MASCELASVCYALGPKSKSPNSTWPCTMDGTQLLVGTKGSEIFEFDMSTEDSWKTNRKIITQGHSAGWGVIENNALTDIGSTMN